MLGQGCQDAGRFEALLQLEVLCNVDSGPSRQTLKGNGSAEQQNKRSGKSTHEETDQEACEGREKKVSVQLNIQPGGEKGVKNSAPITLPFDTSPTTSALTGRPYAPEEDDRDAAVGAGESDDTVKSGTAAAKYQIRED